MLYKVGGRRLRAGRHPDRAVPIPTGINCAILAPSAIDGALRGNDGYPIILGAVNSPGG